MKTTLPPVPIESFRLANGLQVFLVEDHAIPVVAVNINYQVGSKNERPGRTGFAHLFEHMMFQGSQHWDRNYQRPLQEIGGIINGGTNSDRTRYWEQVPAPYLERALWLESDRLGFLLEALNQERLDNQRAVVMNERRQNYDNRPYGTVNEKIGAALFPPNHPYAWPTIGWMADIEAATLADVREFFSQFYTPNNASLAIVGDFDPTAARELVGRYFGEIAPGGPVSRVGRWVPELTDEIVIEIEDRVQLPRVTWAWPTAPFFDPDDAALEVFGRILGSGRTSRLYQELVHRRQVAQDVSAAQNSRQISGTFTVTMTPRPGISLAELESAAQTVLDQALEQGITGEELERMQTITAAEFVRALQDVGGFSGVSDKVNEYQHYLGDPDRFQWDLDRFLGLDPEQVIETARRWIGEDRVRGRVTARVQPVAGFKSTVSVPALDRSRMPGPGADRPFVPPPRERFTLASGLDVLFVPYHKLPLVHFSLLVRGGGATDPAGRFGLASFTTSLIQEGAAGRTSLEIAALREALGAELDITTASDAGAVSLSALVPRWEASLMLLADLALRPDFPAEEIERQRQRRLVQLQQLADQPTFLGGRALSLALFGTHPYGHGPFGDQEGLAAITPEEIIAFHRRAFVPQNCTLLVVGDLTREELEPRLSALLGSWAGDAEPFPPVVPPGDMPGRKIFIVDKPGAPQSLILAGLRGAARNDRDVVTLEVLNTLFGGQFNSRLNLNLREDKGYTYGAHSWFDYREGPGLFAISAPVETAVTAAAVHEIAHELTAILGPHPATAAELAFTRGVLVDGFARRFANPDGIARELADIALYRLPLESWETFPAETQQVSVEDVHRAAARFFHPDRLTFVVVGDAKVVRDGLEALGPGAVEVVS